MARAQGNVYVDAAYTSQEAIDALGGVSPITGEKLIFGSSADDLANGANAFDAKNFKKWLIINGQTIYAAEGSTMYLSNFNVNNDSAYGDGTYKLYLSGASANYLYGVPKTDGTYSNGITIYAENSLIRNSFAPGSFRSGIVIVGPVKVDVVGSTINSMIVGGGTTYQQYGTINGDIEFSVTDTNVTNGDFHIHSGNLSNDANDDGASIVTGTITNVKTSGSFRSIQTDSGNSRRTVKVHYDVAISGSSFGNDINIGYFNNPGDWSGSFVLTVSGSTARDIRGNGNGASPDAATKFDLILGASDKQTTAGTIDRFKAITVKSGANVRATTVTVEEEGPLVIEADGKLTVTGALTASSITMNQANALSTATFGGVDTFAVVDATLPTSGDVIIVSGLTDFEESQIGELTINGQVYSYGVFGGQYSFIGGNLVAHLGETYLVNSNYDGNGIETSLGLKGYKDLSAAQTAAKTSNASLAFTVLDYDAGSPSFSADVSTLGLSTMFLGDGDNYLSLDDVSIIIGDSAANTATADVTIAHVNNVKSIKFGNITESAKVTISDSGTEDNKIKAIDLTGAVITGAAIDVTNSIIGDVSLADQAGSTGKITIGKSTISNVYAAGDGEITGDLSDANTVTNVFAGGQGAKLKLGTSVVTNYIAGFDKEVAARDTLTYNDGASATNLVLGDATVSKDPDDEEKYVINGIGNTIGKIEATITGGNVENLLVGADGNIITNGAELTLSGGQFNNITWGNGLQGDVDVTFKGGTVNTVDGASNGTFYGLIYGASVTGDLDGGTHGNKVVVDGYARVGAIKNFKSLEVTGGTLNVESGDRKSDPTEENIISVSGAIQNFRAIQAGAIDAGSLDNYGLVGVLRNTANDPGIKLTGNFLSTNFVRTSTLTVGGDFANSGEITSVGNITVSGAFLNSGEIYIRSSFDKETSVFSQDGGITLSGVDMVNSGKDAFISTGFLTGVKNLTTSKLYVTGGADITGNITIEAGAEVAFTNKAVKDPESPFAVNGLKLGGSISMYDTSSLIVSGDLTTTGTKTITVNADGMVGSNTLVRAEGGLSSWNIVWGEGLTNTSYGLVKTDTEILIYSVDDLFVNTAFADYEEGDSVIINGKTFVFGLNAFASVEDATYFATTKGFTDSRIAIINDKTGMNIDATGFDVALINSTVGAVTANGIFVESGSKIGSIAASTGLSIDASAALVIDDVIPEGLSVVIDASNGSGARKVLSVNPEKVVFAEGQVTVLAPVGNTTYAPLVTETGDVFLKADANVFLFAEGTEIVDGTVDKATGDVLFAGVNAFTVEADAAAAAIASNGTLYLADGSNKIRAIAGVSKIAIEYNGSSSIYGSEGDTFVSDQDYSVKIAGTTSSAKVYGLNKSVNMSGDYTLVMSDVNLTNAQSALYITGNNVNNVFNGDITAELSNVRVVGRQDKPWNNPGRSWNEGIYIGYGSFGTDPDAPININVTLSGVTSTNSGFYGIQTQPSDGPHDTDESTSGTPAAQQVRQDINANINIKVYDSVFGGTFTVLNTNNEHWDANGASLLNTYFSSGSITVEVGNSDFGDNNIRLGASLQLGGKAIQEFNVPNTLHIVATENGTTTRASYINEWDTIIVDATAQLILGHDIQYSTVFGPDNPLDDAGTLSQIMINMSGYKSGTHNVITASANADNGQISTDATLSNITVIGDNDLTGQCQLAYAFSESGSRLLGIYVFDKADDMYVNSSYTNSISGTKVSGQELLLNYNAFTGFDQALVYADEWGGTIIVTGGEFEFQDFHGNNVEVRAATIGTLTMANEAVSRNEVTLTVKDGAVIGSVDGSNGVTDSSVLEIAGSAQIGDVFDFDTVSVKQGVSLELGNVSGAGFDMFANNELKAASVSFNGTEQIILDVTGYTGEGHAIISTTNGISGFSDSMVTLVAHDKGKVHTDLSNYAVKTVGNDLVLTTKIKTDTYLNSEYTAATLEGGRVLENGVFIEYGFNAFNDTTSAAANLGSQKNTLTVTGGEIAGDIKLGGANFVMDEGVLDGIVYACVNTADKGSFYSGKTYTVTSGTIGGFDLTAGEGVYQATNSAIKLGEDVTITGNIIGGGDTSITSDGKFSVGGLILGVSEIVLNADGFLTAGGIDLGSGEGASTVSGKIRVKAVPFVSEEGNRRLLIESDTDIKNVDFVSDPGTAVYSTGKQVYVIDLSRVYFDPTFTAEIDGTKAANGDTYLWGVNAFNTLNAAKGALITGGTLYVSHANERIGTDNRLINLVISDSNVPVVVSGMTSGDLTFNGSAILTIENSTFGQDGESWLLNRVTAGNPWDHHNTIGGNLYVTISNSTIGGNNNQTTHFIDYLSYTGTEMVFDITDTVIRNDLEFFGDSGPLRDGQSITINLTNVTSPNKWWRITSGNPGNAGAIVVNIKGSSIGTSGDMRFGVQSTWQWGTPSATTDITFSVEDSYFSGYLTAHSIDSGRNCTFTGDKVLNISGSSNYVRAAVHFSTVNIAATSYLSGSTMSLDAPTEGDSTVFIDGTGFDGPTKTLIWENTLMEGVNEIVTKNLADKYTVVKGSRAIVISDGNVGNIFFDAAYTSAVTGTVSNFGDVLIFADDAGEAGKSEIANAFAELEASKNALTAGNKLFVAANENRLFGTKEGADVTPFVDMVVTNGNFSEDGSIIAAADVDNNKSVSGNATIEIAGGSIGKKAVTHEEDDGEGGKTVVVDEEAVYAKISGAGVTGTSNLVVSKTGGIYVDISDFDTLTVNSESRIHGTATVGALTLENTANLTVDGVLDTSSIHISTAGYEGTSKVVLTADMLETFDETAITVDEGGRFYLDRADKQLWLVSTNPGNVYFSSTFSDSTQGVSFNGDLLFFETNAFNTLTKENVGANSTSKDTVYILDGNYAATDLSGIGSRKFSLQGGSTDLTVDAGSAVSVTATTAGVNLSALTGVPVTVGEEVTEGISLVLNPTIASTVGTVTGVNNVTINAASVAKLTVSQIDYLEKGGALTIDFAGYTTSTATNLMTVSGGINNFIQYTKPEEGEAYSTTVVGAANNTDRLMAYYDEGTKTIKIVTRGNAGILDTAANNSVNGTVKEVAGVANTLVYGYNISGSLTTLVNGLADGDTLVVDGANRDIMVESKDLNAIITNSRLGNVQLGKTGGTRSGNYNVEILNSTISARSALAGRGNDENNRATIHFGAYDTESEQYVGESTFTLKGGAYNDSGSTDNVLCITQNANVNGDTVNVVLEDFTLNSDVQMFNNIWNSGSQLKNVNVTMKNVTNTASKWMWIWDPRESNATNININIENSSFTSGNRDYTLGIFGNDTNAFGGVANVTINNLVLNGRLSGARGVNAGDMDVAYTGDAKVTLHVKGTENNIDVVKMFKEIEVEADGLLTGATVSLPEGNTGFILRGTADYDAGAKEFVIAGTTITGTNLAKFVDAEGEEIAGYKAVVGAKNVFIYKPETGDVYYSRSYTADAINGTAVTDIDGTKSFLVYGDNAVTTMAAAYTALEAAGRAGAGLHVENANDTNLYTKGYTTVVNGGNVENLFGGGAPDGETAADPVASVNITVNKDATVGALTVANALSAVTGSAIITINDGVAIRGAIDGGSAYVNETSNLVFTGSASAGSIVGFDSVTVGANSVVSLTGEFTGTAITIDATGFSDFSKKVLTATAFNDVATITITNDPESKFGYQIVNDGEGKALIITSDLVKDAYADASWTESSELGFVGETKLVWDKNAFNSAASAAGVVGEGNVLYIQGGIFSAEEAVTLEKGNDVVVSDDTSIGALATAGKLTVGKEADFVASSISGVSALSMTAGNNFSVAGAVALADKATITIDVTDYTQAVDDVVVLSTGTGITAGEAAIADTAITVTGTGAGSYHAYYNADDSSVHLLKLNTFYLDSTWEGPNETYIGPEYSPETGEKLIFNVNAFIRMNATGAKMVDGQKFWATHRNGSIHTGGPDMAEGEVGKFLSEVHVVDSNVDRIVLGGTNGNLEYTGDVNVFIDKSTICTVTDNDSWLFSNVTADNPWNNRNIITGSFNVDITNSTIGTADGGASPLRIMNYTVVRDTPATETTEAKKSSVNVNIKDSVVNNDIRFIGDSPMGGEDFSILNINLDNVTVAADRGWAIRGGGTGTRVAEGDSASDPAYASTVTVTIKDSTFGNNTRFAIEDNWNAGGTPWESPMCASDFIFDVTNVTVNGALVAGRRDMGDAEADQDPELPNYIGDRVLTVNGSNYVKNAYWFKNVNLTGDSSLQGDTLHMYDQGKINVDLTGYEGPSRVIVAYTFTYDDEGAITGGGIENFDPTKNLVVTGLVEPAEGEEPAYKVLTDYDAETKTISTIVVKGGIQDVFVNSTYNEDDFVFGTAYKTGEAMFYGENAFSTIVGYVDPETSEIVPGAVNSLILPGTVLHVTGGAVETDTLLNNSITIDAGATLAYQGSTTITVDGTIQNNGNFVIDASGFVVGSPERVTVLAADEILGNDIRVTTKAYSVEKALNELTGKTEISLVLKAGQVFVNTAWTGDEYKPGTEVVIDDTTAFIGYTAFASADDAATKVNSEGTIKVIGSTVSFTNAIARGITLVVDGTSTLLNTTIGSDTDGALMLQAGAVASGINISGKSSLLVEAGSVVTGGLGMSANNTNISFATGSTLDFYIVGQSALEGARVTNLSSIGASTPNFTVTVDAGIKDGAYALATNASAFSSSITLQTETQQFTDLTLGNRVKIDEFGAYFELGINENSVLTLTKETAQDVIYVNSDWKDGDVVTVDGNTVTVGENGFATGDAAYAKALSSGASTIKVVGGAVSFTDGIVITTLVQNAELKDTDVTGTLSVSENATLSGVSEFDPAEGKTITINGTVAFDTANTTAEIAQITGLSKAAFGENAKFTLTVTGEVASGDVFLLATGAEGFASGIALVGTDVVLTVGELQKVGELGYKLTLTDGKLALEISDKPVPSVVFVNSTWTAGDGEPVTISDTVTATMGYDAFKTGNPAYSAVAADGEIVVLAGEVSFSSIIEKTLTVDDGAKLTGKATFAEGKVITINGTIVFDTQYAATAQITGLANSTGTTKFELVDTAAAAGTYLLASDAAGFNSDVVFGDYTLTLGGEAVVIGELTYTLGMTENNELALTVVKEEPPTPVVTTAFVNSEWSTLADGTEVTVGEKTAVIGTDAFATLAPAEAIETVTSIEVVGGDISFADGYSKTITVDAAATVVGTANFTATITINGTVVFDTAYATAEAAQFGGFSFVTGSASYTLNAGEVAGTYLLASDAATFSSTVSFKDTTLAVGETKLIGTFNYALGITGNSELALTVSEYVPPTPTYDLVYANSAWTGLADGTEVTVGDKTAIIGANAFASGDLAILNVTDDGMVEVVGGEVSFTNTTAKAITIDAGATLVGKTTFGASATINGAVVFDTAYATATAAQFGGFSFVSGDATYTLNAAAVAGTYLLASDAASFSSNVTFGEYTLAVGAEAIEIGSFKYSLGITSNSELALTIAEVGPGPQPTVPTKAFVNSEWAGLADGTVIAGATIGFDGFASFDLADAAVTTEQAIEVVGGEVKNFTDSYTKTITVDAGTTISGASEFTKAITIDGTFILSTEIATATTAQVKGYANVTGGAQFILVDPKQFVGTYLLVDGITTGLGFTVQFGYETLTVGNSVTVGDLVYTLSNENSVLSLNVAEVPTPPTPSETVYVNSEWANLAVGTVVTAKEGVQATIGTDAFATGDQAAAAVTEDGTIEVVGGSVSFSDPVTEATTIDEGATLTGKAAFTADVTVNGTIEFDTDDAQTGAQFTGFENVTLGENAQLTLTVGELEAGAKVALTDAPIEKTDKNANSLYGKKVSVFGDADYEIGSAYFAAADGISYVLDLDKNGQLVLSKVEQRLQNNENDNLIVNKQPVPEVIGENVPSTILTLENPEVFVDPIGEVKQEIEGGKTFYNFVNGSTDKIDYAQIVVEHGAKLVFNIEATDKAKLTLYSVSTNSKGQWSKKSLKSASLTKANGTKSTAAVYVTGGTYYVAVSNSNKKTSGAFYNVTLNTASSYIFADADNNWNDYVVKSKALNPSIADLNVTEITESGTQSVLFDDAPLTLSDDYQNFVGYTDVTDFAKLSATQPVALTFTLKATGKATLNVYSLTKNSKGVWTQSKSLKSIKLTAKAGGEKSSTVLYLDRLLASTGAEATGYYVSVTSSDKKGNVNYNVSVASQVYADSDFGTNGVLLTASKSLNSDLKSTIIGATKTDVAMEITDGAEGEIVVSKEFNDKTYTSFVGLGDQYDYSEVVLNGTGKLTIDLETYGTTKSTAKITLYKLTQKSNGTWSKSSVGTLSVKTDGTYGVGEGSKTFTIKAATSDTVKYYVGVQSVDAKKGKEVYYNAFATFDGASSSALSMPSLDDWSSSAAGSSLAQDDLLAGQTFDSFADASLVDSSLVDDKQFSLQSVSGLIA